MGKISSFKQEFSFDERLNDSKNIIAKYPDRVPIFGSSRYNTLPQTASLMNAVYDSYKDDDGFLYMCYSSEKTFG
ncbi:hypothetical protein L6164_013740 [Bauhinia variegata]|uniref:Uncharacterized protein n=1 Tax=Bauhinia variegata TaxID=167791 RepID=A0ACB9NGC4_BAUVA|nr:hypothetical protein L6164_013740 [Bauhinia variegata]